MPERDWKIRVKDIKEALDRILEYSAGMKRDEFFSDRKTYDAVKLNLEIIGEAAKNIPDDVRAKHPDIKWKQITGLRDFIAHEYSGLSEDVIWGVVEVDAPELKAQIESGFSDLL